MTLPPFQSFLDDHADAVYRFLVATAGSSEADDCFQETFMAALRAYPRLRPDSNLRAWVMTIAHRKGLDAHRRRARGAVPVAEVPEVAFSHPDGTGEVWRHVAALPPKQRAAVAHRYLADLAYAQIAEIIGCSEDAARQNVSEGLRRLREVVQA